MSISKLCIEAGQIKATLKCRACGELSYISNFSKDHPEAKKLLPYAAMLAGLTFTQFLQISLFANLEGVSKSTWETLEEEMRDVVTELLDEKINQNLKKIKEKIPSGIEIIIDCRWSSRGFFAEEATVTVWETQTNTIIGRYHILRKKEKDSENRTYEGSSKAMEGYGVNKVMQNLQKEGILVKSFTHDVVS